MRRCAGSSFAHPSGRGAEGLAGTGVAHGGTPRHPRAFTPGRFSDPRGHRPQRGFTEDLTKPKDYFVRPPLTAPDACTGLGLVKQYPRVRALDQVSLEIKEGEVFGLFGPNGAGKTTCLRVLSGLTQPDQGSATVCGVDVRAAPNEVRRELGILIDIPFPYEEVTVRRYLSFFAEMAGVPRPEIPAKVEWTMSLLGVTPHADSRIGKLSMGERQRAEASCGSASCRGTTRRESRGRWSRRTSTCWR